MGGTVALCTHLQSSPPPCPVYTEKGITLNICHRPCAVCLMQRQHLLEFLRPSAPEMVFPCSAPTSKGELWDPGGNGAELRNGLHDSETWPCSASYPDADSVLRHFESFLL